MPAALATVAAFYLGALWPVGGFAVEPLPPRCGLTYLSHLISGGSHPWLLTGAALRLRPPGHHVSRRFARKSVAASADHV